MAATTFVMGKNAKLYYGAADAAIDTMTVAAGVRDVTVNLDAKDADVSSRDGGGWSGTAQGMKDCSIEFEMLWKTGETSFEALRDAYTGGTQVALAALTGDKDTVGSEGPHGDFSILGFVRDEPMEGSVVAKVTAKLTVFKAWYKKAAEPPQG